MQFVEYGKYGKCAEIKSGIFSIYVTVDFGPRVIAGFISNNTNNIFAELPIEPMENCSTEFRIYGGHRLWISPEVMPRTYAEDNKPVMINETSDGIEFIAETEKESGIQKIIIIKPIKDNSFKVSHKIINMNNWEIECAPWALSMMAQNGTAIIPQVRNESNNPFIADRTLNLWPYSSLKDERLILGDKYILLKQFDIIDAKLSCYSQGSSKTIGKISFGYDGQIYLSSSENQDISKITQMNNPCFIELFDKYNTKSTIKIEPITGFIHKI